MMRLSVLCLAMMLGCASSKTQAPQGLQEAFLGYIPAKTAVLPCSVWPSRFQYLDLAPNLLTKARIEELCDTFDKTVLEGFTNQPFMKGFSPKAVNQLLKRAERPDLLEPPVSKALKDVAFCEDCTSTLEFYQRNLAPHQEWIAWLNQLSKATRFTDAILLPFVLTGGEVRYTNGGYQVAKRYAEVALLLVDSQSGAAIWSRDRQSTRSDRSPLGLNEPEFPEWAALDTRLFSETLWLDFPGRRIAGDL